MMKASLFAAVLVLAQPAWAQSSPAPADTAASTAADSAELKEARRVVARLMPPGFYKTLLGSSMAPIIDNIGDTMKQLPLKRLAQIGGLSEADAAKLDQVDLAKVMAVYDPYWEDRTKRAMHAMLGAMADFFTTIEPEMREAVAHAYANHFTLAELEEIDRFFATPSGGKFAAQSMTIMTDPALTDFNKSLMPRMVQHMPDIIAAATKAADSLPPPRKIEDLTPAERDAIAKALGVDPSKLKEPAKTI